MREGTRTQGARWIAALGALLAATMMLVVACGGGLSSDDVASQAANSTAGEAIEGGGFDGVAPAPGAPSITGEAAEEAARDRESTLVAPSDTGADVDEAGGSGGPAGTLPALQTLGRTIIRSGSIELAVEDVDFSYHRVQQVATGAGGFVAESTFTGSEEFQRASLTIRVPAERFQEVVDDLRELAVEVISLSTSSQDVTEEYTDLESSLRNLRAVEVRYLELLDRANEIGDILQVQERLTDVRDQMERIEGRIRLLDDLSDLATLSVFLRSEAEGLSPASESTGLGAAVSDAWQASLDAIESVATVAVTAVVFSWWLVPVAVVAYFVGRRWLRRRPRPVHAEIVDTPGESA